MKRTWIVLFVFLLLGAGVSVVGATGEAEASGLSAEFGAESTFLPGFGLDAWADLDWSLDGFGLESLTTLTVLPAFGLNEALSVRYALDPFRFLGELDVDVVPFSFADLSFSVSVDLFDLKKEDTRFSMVAGLELLVLPAFGVSFGFDLDLAVWVVDLWANADLDILTVAFDTQIGAEARVLDLSWDGGELSGFFGASAVVLPGFDARLWFDVAFEAGAVEIRSETDVALTPFELIEQRTELALHFGSLRIYAWGGFRGDLSILAGVGFTYRLPPIADGG